MWGLAALSVSTASARHAWAENLALPADIEAKLIGNIASYERTFAQRAGSKVVVAVIAKASDTDSMHAASSMLGAFKHLDDIGGLPHEEFILPWSDGPGLAAACLQRKVAILFIAPGLSGEIEAIVKTVAVMNVLSIAGSISYVERGVAVGLDLVSGRPQVVINLAMARRQNLQFRADLLSLARIIK